MPEKPRWFRHVAGVLLGGVLGWIVAHAQFSHPWGQVALGLTVAIAGLLALFALRAWFAGSHAPPQLSRSRVLLIACLAPLAGILGVLVYVRFLAPKGWDSVLLLFPLLGGLLVLLKRLVGARRGRG